MKRVIYIALSLCCFVFYSCGMTDPWKDWADENTMSADRLRPSEVKKILCAAEGWKMSYEGTTFYFQFDENGNVTSDSDEGLLKDAVSTEYTLDFQGEKKVLLTLQNGGMLQYLTDGSESTIVITAYNDSQITAAGQTNGKEMTLTATTTTDIQQGKERKRLAIIARNKAEAVNVLKEQLNNGVFRNKNSEFIAHYLLSCDEQGNWKVKISTIVNGAVKHEEVPVTLDTTGDENAILSFNKTVSINGTDLNKFYYNYQNSQLWTDNEKVSCDTKKASEIAAWYTTPGSGWNTHILDQNDIHADFKGVFKGQVEFDDRDPRNLVACPFSGMNSYIGIKPSVTADDATGRIFIKWGEIYDLLGWNNNPADYATVQSLYEKFLSFCSSADGLYWTYEDSTSSRTVYVLSTTGEQWFRMKK